MKKEVIIKKTIIFLILIGISVVFCTNTFAVTKNDIIGYVNSQSVCGDVGLYNTYKSTFTRLLKQKDISESQLDTIYSYLESSVGILNSKGVCKIADLNKLSSSEKNLVLKNLKTAAGIITSAPMIQYGEGESVTGSNTDVNQDNKTNINQNTEGTKVTINTQDNTMDIYENGTLIDKVSISESKMTYTGVNIIHVIIVVFCIVIFVISLIIFMMLYKTHSGKIRCIKNILASFMLCSILIGLVVGIFSNKIDALVSMIDLVSFNNNSSEIKIELNEDKSIKTYPSYGSNYATLNIQKLDIENKVYFGDTTSILSLGIGHSTWSDMPTEDGVVVYSGHNREDMLNKLKNIKKGDEIIVDLNYATCTYEVHSTEVLKDTQIDKLTKVEDKETLILYTCYPFDTYVYTDERFVVYSVLKEVKWK